MNARRFVNPGFGPNLRLLLGRAEGFLQTHLGFQTIEHACSVKAEQNDKNQDGDHDDSFGIHSIAPSYTMSTARQFY